MLWNFQVQHYFLHFTVNRNDQVLYLITCYNLQIFMQVTKDNFSEALNIIDKILPQTQFISFDLQFSGLRHEKFEKDHINYLPFEKYKKLKYVAETYQIMQLGLSFVTFDQKLKIYPFNFYLFPRNPTVYDKNLNLQLGCVKFNIDHGMDWNKWIREGVNYIQLSQMQQYERNERSKSLDDLLYSLNPESQSIAKEFIKLIGQIVRSDKQRGFYVVSPPFYRIISSIFNKYVQQKKLNLAINYIPTNSSKDGDVLEIYKISASDKIKMIQEKKLETFGFALLFKKIWKSKKTFVGHNCFLDLLYLHQCFLEPLPENYFDFKKIIKNSGNKFYDTKYIALRHPQKYGQQTRLEDMMVQLQRDRSKSLIKIDFAENFDRYNGDKSSYHQAGYDSFVTAWVFLQMQQDCENQSNKLNLNFSFFKINFDKEVDQIDAHYARNILRINVDVGQNEDTRQKRTEMVKKIRQHLAPIQDFKAYQIYEGYRQIFIDIRQRKKEVLKILAKIKSKKIFSDIKPFSGYLEWQQQRVRKAALNDQYRDRGNNSMSRGNTGRRFTKDKEDLRKQRRRVQE